MWVCERSIEGIGGLGLVDGSNFEIKELRILAPKTSFSQYEGTGETFPFKSTTDLTPEWPLGMAEATDKGMWQPHSSAPA
jgi:hypothetical protein